MKKIELDRIHVQNYFWRNYKQQEIDYIEEADAKMNAYEIKWNKTKATFPAEFLTEYQPACCEVIHKAKYFDFIF